jgi:riboflavin biosynthesis pyrimidine reductase
MRRLYPTPGGLTGPAELEDEYFVAPARHVRANFVTSLDGMVDIGGRSSPLGGPADRDAFMAMRAVADVVLVGAGTVRQEKYGPVRLDPTVQERRRARGQAPLPKLAVVSNRGDLDPQAKCWDGEAKPLLITTTAAAEAHAELAAVADMVVCGDQFVDLRLALDELSTRGLQRVLCEGGPTLFRTLVTAGLIDELCLTTSTRLVGPEHRGLLGDQPLTEPASLSLTGVLEGDGMLLSRYAFGAQS